MSNDLEQSMIVVDVQETIRFFDEKPDWSLKQATSIVSVIGEDLAAGCFQKHLESKGATVCIRYIEDGDCIYPEPVNTGRLRGSRLDRWIVVDCPVATDGRYFRQRSRILQLHAIWWRNNRTQRIY